MMATRKALMAATTAGVLAAAWYVYRPVPTLEPPSPADEPTAGLSQSAEPPEELGTLEEFENSIAPPAARTTSDRTTPARTETPAPLPPDVSDIWSMAPDNIAERVGLNVDLALEGDLEAAYFLQKAHERCRNLPRDRDSLEEQIDRFEAHARRQERSRRGGSWSTGYGPGNMQFSSSDDVRPQMQDWYAACQDVRAVFSLDLRAELDRLAGQGHVVARYLYATWPVEKSDPALAFEQQLVWSAKARDYSLANLQAGEPLGLLAFAQSYQAALFTRFDREMTFGFAHAALNCGLPIENVQRYVDNYLDRADQSDRVSFLAGLEFALAVSDSLSAYCRD